MEKKAAHKNCVEHRWAQNGHSSHRSIGTVTIIQCNNCLSVKVVQQKKGWEIEPPVETLIEMNDSAYNE